jgi:hypothetical protein
MRKAKLFLHFLHFGQSQEAVVVVKPVGRVDVLHANKRWIIFGFALKIEPLANVHMIAVVSLLNSDSRRTALDAIHAA